MDKEYRAIKLHEIYPNQILGFDVFLYLTTNGKFLKYIDGRSSIDEEQIRRLKFRNVDELYVRSLDFPKYSKLLSTRLRTTLNNKNITEKEKTAIIQKETIRIFDSIDSLSDEEDAISWTNRCVELTSCLTSELTESKVTISTISDKLKNVLSGEPSLVNHSLAVSSLSAVLGMLLGLHDPKSISELSIGALLHDMGLQKCPSNIIELYLEEKVMSSHEKEIYEKHPRAGLEMASHLLKAKAISDNVLKIIHEHHETPAGQGFPSGLNRFNQSYLPKIVTLADILSVRILNRGIQSGLKSHLIHLVADEENAKVKKISKNILQPLMERVISDK